MPIWAHVPADAGQVMRDEKDDTPKAAESSESEPEKKKKKSDISFGSAAVPWYVVKPLILKFPSRWQVFAQKERTNIPRTIGSCYPTSAARCRT